jgi:hypothetical protein
MGSDGGSRRHNNSSNSINNNIDTTLLRNALRLIHCVQKERGISCAYYANNEKYSLAMSAARRATDTAIRIFQSTSVAKTLGEIRHWIDDSERETIFENDSSEDSTFHRIFVSFNSLISSLVNDNILHPWKEFRSDDDSLDHPMQANLQAKAFKGIRSRRTGSVDFNDGKSNCEWMNDPPHSPVKKALDTRALAGNRFGDDISASNDKGNSSKWKHDSSTDKNLTTARGLFAILVCFSQLKESTGVERAIMSSLLAFGHRNGTSRLLNDLVLEVENQRSLSAQLELFKEGPLRNLILDLAQLSPYLKELQDVILNDFTSLDTAKYDSETFWNTITMYMDKLHSVELLIMEDLESELFHWDSSVRSVVSGTRFKNKHLLLEQSLKTLIKPKDGTDLVSALEKMTSEEIKSLILQSIQEKETLDNASSDKKVESNQYAGLGDALETNVAGVDKSQATSLSEGWQIDIYEIKFRKRIGQGSFATTYLASWNAVEQVAIKVASTTENGLEGWRTEVAALQKLHHPNVIRLLGSVEHKNPLTYCLVLEYCNAGDLATVLKYPTPRNFFFHVSCSLANAMMYLHKRHILHRDLKPGNVLCHGNIASGNFEVKVTDFGVARELGEAPGDGPETKTGKGSKGNLTGETGTYRWMAPEVIRHENYGYPADVYSFSIMLWEFLTREDPYYEFSSTDAALRVASESLRPPLPAKTPTELADLIKTCWSEDPTSRLDFENIVKGLTSIKGSLTEEQRKWVESAHGDPVYCPRPEVIEKETENEKQKGKVKKADDRHSFFGRFGKKK